MADHNQDPSIPERETFKQQEMVKFNDGEIALGFRTPGDVLHLGRDSLLSRARQIQDPTGEDMAIVRTRSGNTYGIGNGMMINARTRRVSMLPPEIPDITLGDSWQVPGVASTTEVEQVLFRYKLWPSGPSDVELDKPSPFPALEAQLRLAAEQMQGAQQP